MKKVYLFVMGVILSATIVWAEVGDITENISINQANMVRMESITINADRKFCRVVYRRYYDNGTTMTKVGGQHGKVDIVFINISDDPSTPEDETSPDFTDLMTFIDGGTLKTKLTTAVKTKLGI